jgi:hypothetical protein
MEELELRSHMGKLIGIYIKNRRFMLGQLAYNKNNNKFILAQELLFLSFRGYQDRIIESDYFSAEDVISIETHCKPDFEISWEQALYNNPMRLGKLREKYEEFRTSALLQEFEL